MGIFVAFAAVAAAYILVYRTRFGLLHEDHGQGTACGSQRWASGSRRCSSSGWRSAVCSRGSPEPPRLLGVQYNFSPTFNPGYGFDAIGIAILSKGNPIAVLIFAFVFGGFAPA